MEDEQIRTTLLGNPAKPQGQEGEKMLLRMNNSHAAVTKWAFDFMDVKENDRILDIGCGGGAALARLSEKIRSGHLTGLDYSSVSVDLARKLNNTDIQNGKTEIVAGSVEHLPFADNQFDKIVTVESFYFWPDPAENLNEVFRTLKKGGKFFLTLDIYRSENMSEDAKQAMEIHHLYVPAIDELQEMFRKAGFTDIQPHTFPSESWICAEGTKPL